MKFCCGAKDTILANLHVSKTSSFEEMVLLTTGNYKVPSNGMLLIDCLCDCKLLRSTLIHGVNYVYFKNPNNIVYNVAATARKLAKLGCRQEPLEWLVANKEKDLQQFIGFINQPAVQMGLDHYLESLKRKK
jgi:hypothetical protein